MMEILQIKGFTVRVYSFDEIGTMIDRPEVLPGIVRGQPDGTIHIFPHHHFPVRLRPGEYAVAWPDGDIITTTEKSLNSIKAQGA